MTGPHDTSDNTRPISVAELLAKNGTIGAPPTSTRRRKRRGNADARTVAELTGEIPIIDERMLAAAQDVTPEVPADDVDAPAEGSEDGVAAEAQPTAAAESDYEAHIKQRDSEPEPLAFEPRRPSIFARATEQNGASPESGAEQMSPDPVGEDWGHLPLAGEEHDASDELAALSVVSFEPIAPRPLFSGQPVADELARTGAQRTATGTGNANVDLVTAFLQDTDLRDAADAPAAAKPASMPSFTHAASTIGQCILAVAVGAGLFVGFDQLWRWNNYVALALSILVILGLLIGVRVLRKAGDVASLLIAACVGAMITLGPVALLQSG